MRTSILFTIPNFMTAGSGREMLNIIERLDRNAFSPTVCVTSRGGSLEKEIEEKGIPILELPFKISGPAGLGLLAQIFKTADLFRPYHFRIWHSFNWSSDVTE